MYSALSDGLPFVEFLAFFSPTHLMDFHLSALCLRPLNSCNVSTVLKMKAICQFIHYIFASKVNLFGRYWSFSLVVLVALALSLFAVDARMCLFLLAGLERG